MVSQKTLCFNNMHFLKMLQKRYTGGRFSTKKPLQNKSFFVTCSFSEGILMILKSKKTTFRKVIFRNDESESGQSFSKPWSEFFQAWSELFRKHQFDVGIHAVFENVHVARYLSTFSARQTLENHAF